MSDPIADAVQFLADQLDLPSHTVKRALEAAEAAGVLDMRVIDEYCGEATDMMSEIREKGRGKCLCSLSTIERVLIGHGTCGRGGCPYGGDI